MALEVDEPVLEPLDVEGDDVDCAIFALLDVDIEPSSTEDVKLDLVAVTKVRMVEVTEVVVVDIGVIDVMLDELEETGSVETAEETIVMD